MALSPEFSVDQLPKGELTFASAKEVGARAKKIVDVKLEGPITLTPEQLAIVAAGFVAAVSGGHGATTGWVAPATK